MIPSDKTMNELARLNEQAMTPTPTKKEWCGHIVWERIYGLHAVTYGWWLNDDDMEVRPTWTRCPICGKERPKG